MALQETINTFSGGLQLDTSDLIISNTMLTDCLNGTLITMNGNEMMLQNDMGNGRIHSAMLKPGFIPLGLAEYGGVVYVASHNPMSGESELGSFPSPQRNYGFQEALGGSNINQTADIPTWNTGTCLNYPKSAGQAILGDKGRTVLMQLENKDVWLNPGDLFKLNIITGGADTYKKYVNYINADGDQTPNVLGTETPYQKAFALGLKKPVNFDLIVRNAMGGADDVTKTLLNENDNLNNVFNFGDTLDVNDQGDKIKTDEELLDQYREAVQTEGYSIYSGKYSGTLNFSISLNQTKGFSVAPSYLINIKRDEESEIPKSTISYSVILRVVLPKYYREDYIVDTIGTTQNEYLKVVNLKKDNLLVEGVDMANVSEFIKLKNSKNEFEISEADKQTLIDLYSIGKDEDADARLQQIFSGEDLYGIFVIKDIPIKDEDKEYPEGDETGKFSFTFVPQTQLGFECKNTQTWEIDFNNLNNSPFTLNTWNYYTNYDNENPLELNFGYEGSYDENIVNKVSHCVISFFDIYHNRELRYYVKIMNNGTNFKSYTIDIPYRTAGSMGALDTNTLEPEVYDQIYEDENSYYKRILIDGTGLTEQEDPDTGIMKLSGGGKAKILDPISQYYKDSKNELTLSDDLAEVREANKDIVFIEGRDIKPETSPLIKSSLYLCCIQLVDNNDELITQDYRFLYTTPTFDEQNIHDDFVELFPEIYPLFQLNREGSVLQNLELYSPTLEYVYEENVNTDPQLFGVHASYVQSYNIQYLNQFFSITSLKNYIEDNLDKVISSKADEVQLFFDQNDFQAASTKVSLEEYYNQGKEQNITYILIQEQGGKLLITSEYFVVSRILPQYQSREGTVTDLSPIDPNIISTTTVEKENDSIDLQMQMERKLSQGHTALGEGFVLNRFNSSVQSGDVIFVSPTVLSDVSGYKARNDSHETQSYSHSHLFLASSFLRSLNQVLHPGSLFYELQLFSNENDWCRMTLWLNHTMIEETRMDVVSGATSAPIDLSLWIQETKTTMPLFFGVVPVYIVSKVLGVISTPEYLEENTAAQIILQQVFAPILVSSEESREATLNYLSNFENLNAPEEILLQTSLNSYPFLYNTTLEEVRNQLQNNEEIVLNNITYDSKQVVTLTVEADIQDQVLNDIMLGDGIVVYTDPNTNKIKTRTNGGEAFKKNEIYVVYQDDIYSQKELMLQMFEIAQNQLGEDYSKYTPKNAMKKFVERMTEFLDQSNVLSRFELSSDLYMWTPLLFSFQDRQCQINEYTTQSLVNLPMTFQGWAQQEGHANTKVGSLKSATVRVFPLPLLVKSKLLPKT